MDDKSRWVSKSEIADLQHVGAGEFAENHVGELVHDDARKSDNANQDSRYHVLAMKQRASVIGFI